MQGAQKELIELHNRKNLNSAFNEPKVEMAVNQILAIFDRIVDIESLSEDTLEMLKADLGSVLLN